MLSIEALIQGDFEGTQLFIRFLSQGVGQEMDQVFAVTLKTLSMLCTYIVPEAFYIFCKPIVKFSSISPVNSDTRMRKCVV